MEKNNSHPIIRSIEQGCKLAKKMEAEIPLLWGDTPNIDQLSQNCDEIIEAFRIAKLHLASLAQVQFDHHVVPHHHLSFQHLLKAKDFAMKDSDCAGIGIGGSSSSASPHLPRKSKNSTSRNDENRRVRVAAPTIGNTDLPPEDNFTWRKYGQKEILNARFPRSYYRCTHQKLYNCPAKKQVQRLDDDPSTYDILYRGEHTCHMSNTAPSIPPPPIHHQDHHIIFPDLHQSITNVVVSSPLFNPPWQLSLDDLNRPSNTEGTLTVTGGILFDHPQHQDQQHDHPSSAIRSSSSLNHNHSFDLIDNQIGSSFDSWIDVFNTGSSSSNTMDVVFTQSHPDDKNDQ